MVSPPASAPMEPKPSLSENRKRSLTPLKVYAVAPLTVDDLSFPSFFDHVRPEIVKEEFDFNQDPITASMLPAPISFTHVPPSSAPYYPSYNSYGEANYSQMQQQLPRQQFEQQAQYNQYGGYPTPSIISQQHAAMVSAHLQQAHHQRIYQEYLLAASRSASSLGSNASFNSILSLSPHSSPNSSINLENSPRSLLCSNELSFLGAASHEGEFTFAEMSGMTMVGDGEDYRFMS